MCKVTVHLAPPSFEGNLAISATLDACCISEVAIHALRVSIYPQSAEVTSFQQYSTAYNVKCAFIILYLRVIFLPSSLQNVAAAARGPRPPPHVGVCRSRESPGHQELSGGNTGVYGQTPPGTG